MENDNTKTLKKNRYVIDTGEKKTETVMSVLFMAAYYIFPQYFGFDTPFFDFSVQRIMIVLFLIFTFEKQRRTQQLWGQAFKSCGHVWLFIYLFILLYTAIARSHAGTFLYSAIEALAMFIVIYIVREGIGVKKFVNLINTFAAVLCISGLIEYVMKRSPFSYLETIDDLYCGALVRGGYYRIMGPANHALGYGLILITMASFIFIDVETDKISLWNHPVLLALLTINVFLTGSRSTLGIYLMQLAIVFIMCSAEEKRKTIIILVAVLAVVVPLVVVTSNMSFSRYLIRTFMTVVDQILGTSFAVRWGADVSTLANSSAYRSQLNRIFGLKWLDPLLGQGSQYQFYWKTDNGFTIQSIDNAYIAMYIRYGYPGMISYIIYIVVVGITMLVWGIKKKSGLFLALFVGYLGYFINLRYVDTLQTIKYAYIAFAVFFACYDSKNKEYVPYCIRTEEPQKKEAVSSEVTHFKYLRH
jgi:hypothetical protein